MTLTLDHAHEEALIAISREQRKALVAEVMAENRPRLMATLSVVATAMQNSGLPHPKGHPE